MLTIYSKTFNPEMLYVFDSHTKGPASSTAHSHEYFEFTLFYQGESFFMIGENNYYINEPSILILNPGVTHHEYSNENMQSIQIHIGLRDFKIPGFEKNVMPFTSQIIQLKEHQDEFLEICSNIIQERKKAKKGHNLLLKSYVFQLIAFSLRESKLMKVKKDTTEDDLEKQKQIEKIKTYIEENYSKNLTLAKIADTFFISQTTLSRNFKEIVGDSPINHLIDYRLAKAKDYLVNHTDSSIKELATKVGYSDSLYFGKIFKEKYGYSPSCLIKKTEKES